MTSTICSRYIVSVNLRFKAAPAVCLISLALIAAAAAAEGPRSALEVYRGTWTVKGHERKFKEACEWLPGQGFLACHSDDRSESKASFGLSIFGYSELDGQYTYNRFSGSGTQRALRGNVHAGVWRFHGQSDRGPNWRRWQVTITPTDYGFHFREEVSDRSGPWTESTVVEYVRLDASGR